LLLYEVANAVLQAMRRERLVDEQGAEILTSFEGLGISLEPVAWQQILPLAQRFGRSAYDAAYLALAEVSGQPLVTGDERMYNAVHEQLPWVKWIGDYNDRDKA
jgi:predicted nucleic acid-binding protein